MAGHRQTVLHVAGRWPPRMAPIPATLPLMGTRRGWGEDGIFFEHTAPCRDSDKHRHCQGRWRGVVSLGFGPDGKRIRRKVSGKTRAVVQDRLKTLHHDLDSGVQARPNYTLRRAAEDWLAEGLDGRSAKTIKKNENVLAPILTAIGARRLRELTAADVHQALTAMATRYSTAAVAMGHNALTRVIRHAEARDLVARNVATLVDTPKGQPGRPSKSLTLAASVRTAGRRHRHPDARLHRPLPGDRNPDRRSPRPALGTHQPRRPRRRPARPAQRRRLAISTGPRRHQNREIPPDPGPAPDGRRRAPRSQGTASC